MTQAVVTRRDGDVFQARMFWLKAANLLDADGSILRVGFESGLRGFDDVWVEYEPSRAPQDQFGEPLLIERMQCKWHATPGSYDHQDLIRPEYINATTTSLLQGWYWRLTSLYGVEMRTTRSTFGNASNGTAAANAGRKEAREKQVARKLLIFLLSLQNLCSFVSPRRTFAVFMQSPD